MPGCPRNACLPLDTECGDPIAEYVKEAVQEDQAGNYQKAFELYKIALDYFSTHLKYEKNPRSKAAISEKVPTLRESRARMPVACGEPRRWGFAPAPDAAALPAAPVQCQALGEPVKQSARPIGEPIKSAG